MSHPPLALALHAGAGAIPRDSSPERRDEALEGLRRALERGREVLLSGAPALDVVEAVVLVLEDDPLFNAGRGAVLNRDGENELEASIMDGARLACGAAGGLRVIRHPISLARLLLEEEDLIFLVGPGAEARAREAGLEEVPPEFFTTPRRRRQLERALGEGGGGASVSAADPERGTVGCVALDGDGRLAAATSTGGRTGKRRGRIGDSPVIGAGTYANHLCAVSGTGVGEQFLRFTVARDLAARMEFAGQDLREAGEILVHQVLSPGDGGLVAVDHLGNVAMPFNSPGMYRAAFSTQGVDMVGIWDQELPGAPSAP